MTWIVRIIKDYSEAYILWHEQLGSLIKVSYVDCIALCFNEVKSLLVFVMLLRLIFYKTVNINKIVLLCCYVYVMDDITESCIHENLHLAMNDPLYVP